MDNPYAVYVNCDGAMDYGRNNPGGVGYVINFPESVDLETIELSVGTFCGGNIEQIEIEALIQAMRKTKEVFESYSEELQNVNDIIFITDRLGLVNKANPYTIKGWRQNKWKNHEGKPIKNHKLLDELDKARSKLIKSAHAKVSIEWRRRKENKKADKLAKAGKKEGLPNTKLKKAGEKIGRRKYSGDEVDYKKLMPKDNLHINIFRKEPVQDMWEVCAEICSGKDIGAKLKIYTDDLLQAKLKRGNEFIIRIKRVFRHYIEIYRTLSKPKDL